MKEGMSILRQTGMNQARAGRYGLNHVSNSIITYIDATT
jgi:hypothetical protein